MLKIALHSAPKYVFYKAFLWRSSVFHRRPSQVHVWGIGVLACIRKRYGKEAWVPWPFRLFHTHHMFLTAFKLTFVHCWAWDSWVQSISSSDSLENKLFTSCLFFGCKNGGMVLFGTMYIRSEVSNPPVLILSCILYL